MGRSKGTAAAETARASQGLQRRGVDDTVARRRWGKMEDGAEVDGAKSDIALIHSAPLIWASDIRLFLLFGQNIAAPNRLPYAKIFLI